MNVVKHIICELTGYRPGSVDVSQGDRRSRAVSCRLLENGAPWMVPEGATARVAYTLPDGTEGLYDRRPDGTPMWEISQNTVTVELADQLMAQAGMVQVSIVLIGPEGGQLATWPIRVMVTANKPARLAVPEGMPPYGAGFAGKIFFGGKDGTVTPLIPGEGVEVVLMEDGSYKLVASGSSGGGGGIIEEKDPTVPEWAKQSQKPSYTAQEVGALPKDTKIPGKTSELTNDAGFVDKAVSDLKNYFTIKQTQELLAAIPRFRVTVVQQLPTVGEELVLYLVPFATAEGQYLEYIWVGGRFEVIGSQKVDLTGYATEEWVQAGYQPKGDYLLATALPGAIEDALEQAKAGGLFDGDDGITPHIGANGNWYVGNADTGVKAQGAQGPSGRTPVKGVDYWPPADQEAIVQQAIAALGTPVFGRVDADNNIILSGELVDGVYTVKYEDGEGNQTEIGTLNHVVVPAPTYVNQIPLSINADGSPYIGDNGEAGYRVGYRINSTNVEIEAAGMGCTGYIPCTWADTLRFANIGMSGTSANTGRIKLSLYDADFSHLHDWKVSELYNNKEDAYLTALGVVFDSNENLTMLGMTALSYWGFTPESTPVAYIRVTCDAITDQSIITINEEITG